MRAETDKQCCCPSALLFDVTMRHAFPVVVGSAPYLQHCCCSSSRCTRRSTVPRACRRTCPAAPPCHTGRCRRCGRRKAQDVLAAAAASDRLIDGAAVCAFGQAECAVPKRRCDQRTWCALCVWACQCIAQIKRVFEYGSCEIEPADGEASGRARAEWPDPIYFALRACQTANCSSSGLNGTAPCALHDDGQCTGLRSSAHHVCMSAVFFISSCAFSCPSLLIRFQSKACIGAEWPVVP